MTRLRRDGSRPLESSVEAHLQNRMARIGGRAFKFMPALKGTPDRLVVFPCGRIFFVELKRPGGVLSPAQKLWHARMFKMGHVVHVIDNVETVDAFVAWAMLIGERDDRAADMAATQNNYLKERK